MPANEPAIPKPTGPGQSSSRGAAWRALLQNLTAPFACDPRPFEESLQRAEEAGGAPFEAIVGSPVDRYGVRLTLAPQGAPAELAAALGLADHPWGPPDWIGLRMTAQGEVRAKAYHLHRRARAPLEPPAGAPVHLLPVMAALDGGSTELYLRLDRQLDWGAFAARCAALLGGREPAVAPRPRPVARGFCVSFAWEDGELASVTLYADSRGLRDDASVRRQWSRGLEARDLAAYEGALAGTRSLGRQPLGGWHAMLAWTLDSSGLWRRAVSLRLPRVAG